MVGFSSLTLNSVISNLPLTSVPQRLTSRQVLETSWHKLVKDLKAAKDLDELIDSHEEYIAAIKKNVRIEPRVFSSFDQQRVLRHGSSRLNMWC